MQQSPFTLDSLHNDILKTEALGQMERRMTELIACATQVTFNMMLERLLALPDTPLLALNHVLNTCGQISDESGQLMSRVLYQLFHVSQIEQNDPVQHRQLWDVMNLRDCPLDTVVGNSVRMDALNVLVTLVRSLGTISIGSLREKLNRQLNAKIYQRLLDECLVFRQTLSHVLAVNQAKLPKPAKPLTHHFQTHLDQFENLGQWAITSQPKFKFKPQQRGSLTGLRLPEFLVGLNS